MWIEYLLVISTLKTSLHSDSVKKPFCISQWHDNGIFSTGLTCHLGVFCQVAILFTYLYWSPRLAYESLLLTLSVCPSVCLSVSLCVTIFKLLLLFFVSRRNRAMFWPSVPHDPLYKMLIFDFRFRPPNAQNLVPKICTKSPISRLVWQIDRRCLGLPGGFRGWPIQWYHGKCCGADLCCHCNEISARRGDPVAYRLV